MRGTRFHLHRGSHIMMVILVIFAFLSALVPLASADEIQVSRFGSEGLAGWESKSFKGTTDYRLVKEEGRAVVKAAAHNSASGMIRKISFQPSKHRYLRWSWKIAHTIKGGDEKLRSGDDYAARLYVLFPGRFFWQMKAINYIWANKLAKGGTIPNAFTANTRMIAVESGNGKAGQWLAEERDLLADYRALFGTDPPEAEAVAIMTDSDNTGETAEAWYGEISLGEESR